MIAKDQLGNNQAHLDNESMEARFESTQKSSKWNRLHLVYRNSRVEYLKI